MPSFDFSKLGYYRNLFLFTFVTSRLALILSPSEITADNSGSWSDSNPIVIQCLKKTGSANWTRSRSEWDYNPIRLTRQKRAFCLQGVWVWFISYVCTGKQVHYFYFFSYGSHRWLLKILSAAGWLTKIYVVAIVTTKGHRCLECAQNTLILNITSVLKYRHRNIIMKQGRNVSQ